MTPTHDQSTCHAHEYRSAARLFGGLAALSIMLAAALLAAGCVSVDKRTGVWIEGDLNVPELDQITGPESAVAESAAPSIDAATVANASASTTASHAEQHAHADRALFVVKSNNRSDTEADTYLRMAAELVGNFTGQGTSGNSQGGGADAGGDDPAPPTP